MQEVRIPVSEGLSHFHGGVHLPTMKAMSVTEAVTTASLPDKLIIPMGQHIGQLAEPVVKVGDTVLKGQLIAQAPSYVSAPVHAPTSGTISDISDQSVPHPSGLNAQCITLIPDGKDQWCELFPVEDYTSLDPIALRNKVRDAGIVGLGGAAFPSSVKLNPGPSRKVERLVINGAECEPYITCDQTLMSERAHEVIGGVQIIMHTIGVDACWIAIEDTMPTALEGLSEAIRQAGEESRIEVKVIPTIYPTGGEKQLIKVLTGQEVPSNGLPADIGIVCHNPGTASAIYKAITLGQPLISRLLTVTGHGVKQPRNFEVLFGTPMAHLVAEAGGYKDSVERLIMGGPMMGFAVHTDELPIVKATNCILVAEQGEIADPAAADPCIRCGACADACPANLLPQQLYWYSKSQQFEQAREEYNLFDCIECGCCSHVCPSNIPLVQYYRYAKTEIRNAETDKRKSDRARERHEFREARLEREQREKAEQLRKKREELARKQKQAANQKDGKSPEKDMIAEAVARAQARKEKLAAEKSAKSNTSPQDAKQAAIAAAKAKAAEKQAAQSTSDPKKAAIEAAKQRAKAKAAGNSEPTETKDTPVDPKKAAIEAAKQRAKAKAAGNSEPTETKDTPIDPKKAAIEAAKKRALEKPLATVRPLKQRMHR